MLLFKGELKIARYGDEPELVPPPKLIANAIVLINQYGNGDAVYWDGTEYRWYTVKELPK